ncbi:MAG: hypothetical protein A2583_15315 [Bdellovibrionales bacterium RIFOXYD1_FULL_53_11]|nr:MAG: hypothetical protein A2583_15315 [Bdellovibrionales bacterium RIFOXYD1_FULL_53_11]
MTKDRVFDVVVVGAGVVGAGIVRELSKYDLKVALVDKQPDVGDGTSKGNSAIMHTGFDAKPGTLESQMVREGSVLFRTEVAPALNIPFEETGAMLVARTDDEFAQIPKILEKARENKITDVRQLTSDEMYGLEPHLAQGVKGGVLIPKESITCPFTPPLAYVTQAVVNGAKLFLNTEVTGVRFVDGVHDIATTNGQITTRYVINSSGLFSDRVEGFMGFDNYKINPRKGEFIVYDKFARRLVKHILLQVPTPHTKGILISPTIFGNVLLGPTADDHDDVNDTSTSREGLMRIQKQGSGLLPGLIGNEDITTTYAGNRSATQFAEYQVFFRGEKNWVTVGGIRSTGLSASLALARHVVEGMRGLGLALSQKREFKNIRMPEVSEFRARPYQCPDTIRGNQRYGHIVCFCEKVSEQEIRDALGGVIPAANLSAVKRRTRAAMGRCQGFNCMPVVMRMIAEARGMSVKQMYESGVQNGI